jgi:hypothetical protein
MSFPDRPETGEIEYLRQLDWAKLEWRPSPALVHKSGSRVSLYVGQKFHDAHITHVQDGWDYDRCELCSGVFSQDVGTISSGYRSGNVWVCHACFETYLEGELVPEDQRVAGPTLRKTRFRMADGWVSAQMPLVRPHRRGDAS